MELPCRGCLRASNTMHSMLCGARRTGVASGGRGSHAAPSSPEEAARIARLIEHARPDLQRPNGLPLRSPSWRPRCAPKPGLPHGVVGGSVSNKGWPVERCCVPTASGKRELVVQEGHAWLMGALCTSARA